MDDELRRRDDGLYEDMYGELYEWSFRQWAIDTFSPIIQIIVAGLLGAAIGGVIAGQPWMLVLLIPAFIGSALAF